MNARNPHGQPVEQRQAPDRIRISCLDRIGGDAIPGVLILSLSGHTASVQVKPRSSLAIRAALRE